MSLRDAQQVLKNSPLHKEDVQKILRMSREDKLCNNSIASYLHLRLDWIEAALWKPRHLTGYSLFQKEMRHKVQGMQFHDQASMLSDMWKNVDQDSWRARAQEGQEQARNEGDAWADFLNKWMEQREAQRHKESPAKRKVRSDEELRVRKEEAVRAMQAKKLKAAAASEERAERESRGEVQQQSALQASNSSMKKAFMHTVQIRAAFYKQHWKLISTFLPEDHRSLTSPFARKLMPVDGAKPSLPLAEVSQPKSIKNGTMFEYQIDGLRWMIEQHRMGVGGILGDEMGLGKTLQVISFVAHLHDNGETGPFFVCAPLSVLPTWQNEFQRWCPSLKTVVFHGSAEDRNTMKHSDLLTGTYDVVLTTYEMVVSDIKWLSRQYYRYLILDEAQRIKNNQSLIGQAVRKLRGAGRLLITGTPLQNDLHELWCLLNFMFPELFDDSAMFDAAFSKVIGKSATMDFDLVQAAHRLLQPLMLRRLKRDVQTDLPYKKTLVVWCPLSDMQRFWYKQLLINSGEAKQLIGGMDENGSDARWRKLQGLLMQLRKCCNHPYLFPGSEEDESVTDERIITASAKMQILDRLLERLHAEGRKVLVYSQFTTMLDVIQDYLSMKGTRFLRLDGSTSLGRRKYEIALFNNPKSTVGTYLLSTRAGALGITLTGADTVIMVDSDWNPTWDKQAHDRAHRIGQTKEVTVYQLITRNTVEERVFHRAQQKLALNELVLRDDSEPGAEEKPLSNGEIKKMLACGAKAILAGRGDSSTGPIGEKELDAIIDGAQTNKSMMEEFKAKEEMGNDGEEEEEGVDLMELAFHGVREFEGQTFKEKNRNESYRSIADQWVQSIAGKKREVQSTVISVGKDNIDRWSHEQRIAQAAQAQKAKTAKKTRVPADTHCIVCAGSGPGLVQCGSLHCHRAMHSHCAKKGRPGLKSVAICPQHACTFCHANGTKAHGLLFRCLDCSNTFCPDCLPNPEQFDPVDRLDIEDKIGHIPGCYEYLRCSSCMDAKASHPSSSSSSRAIAKGSPKTSPSKKMSPLKSAFSPTNQSLKKASSPANGKSVGGSPVKGGISKKSPLALGGGGGGGSSSSVKSQSAGGSSASSSPLTSVTSIQWHKVTAPKSPETLARGATHGSPGRASKRTGSESPSTRGSPRRALAPELGSKGSSPGKGKKEVIVID